MINKSFDRLRINSQQLVVSCQSFDKLRMNRQRTEDRWQKIEDRRQKVGRASGRAEVRGVSLTQSHANISCSKSPGVVNIYVKNPTDRVFIYDI